MSPRATPAAPSAPHKSRASTALVIIKGALDAAVPIISIAQHLNALDYKVRIVCSDCSEPLRDELSAAGLTVTRLQAPGLLPSIANSPLQKPLQWLSFRYKCSQILRRLPHPDLVYVGSADTALALGGTLRARSYVLHLRELHDKQPAYMRLLRSIAQNARRVVVPEENRAFIYFDRFGLTGVPVVIPNKPFNHPRSPKMDISFLEPKLQAQMRSKKNIVYQGPIHKERDMSALVEAMSRLDGYNLVLMGKDYGMLPAYKSGKDSLIHIPFVRPPLHLNVTSWADIGIITYDTASLNTIYCAPNKMWEFSGFGIPILGSRNLGLKYTIGAFDAGELVDFASEDAIFAGVEAIESRYEAKRTACLKFYDSVNVPRLVAELCE